MLLLAAVSLAALVASPAPCKYEQNCQCAAPGITIRWKAAHCLFRVETDDFFHSDVQKCMDERDPPALKKMDACARNAYWKASVCRSLYKDAKEAQTCIDDRTYVPRAVEEGVE